MPTSRFSQVLFCAATVLLIVGLIGVRPNAQTGGRTGAANQTDPCAAPANRIIVLQNLPELVRRIREASR